MRSQSPHHVLSFGRGIAVGAALVILTGLTSCAEIAMQERLKLTETQIVARICELYTPITDTTSKQVRAYNRARYVFCEGDLPTTPGEVK